MKRLIAAFALALAFAGGAPAFAQIDKQGGPIEVRADKTEAFTNEGRYIWTSNVDAVQGNARLKSDKMTLLCSKPTPDPKAAPADRAGTACADITSLVADGSVYYLTPDGKITGDHAEYDYANKVVTVTGKVILSRGDGSVITGCRLVYEVDPGKVTITNNCSTQAATSQAPGQVFSVFIPQDKKPKPAEGAPPSPQALPPGAPQAAPPAPSPSASASPAAPPASPSASH